MHLSIGVSTHFIMHRHVAYLVQDMDARDKRKNGKINRFRERLLTAMRVQLSRSVVYITLACWKYSDHLRISAADCRANDGTWFYINRIQQVRAICLCIISGWLFSQRLNKTQVEQRIYAHTKATVNCSITENGTESLPVLQRLRDFR